MINTEFVKNKKYRRFSGNLSLRSTTYTVRSQFIQFLLNSKLSKSKVIMDFGAGNSPYKKYFRFECYETADVNYNVECVADYIIDPLNPKIPVPDCKYDLVLALDVLEHVPEFPATLDEIIRVCKRGGHIIIKTPFLYREHETPFDFRRFTSYGFKRELEKRGLNIIELKGLGNSWSVAYSLIMERLYENTKPNIIYRILNKFFSITITPVLNITLFKNAQTKGIYGSILAVAQKIVY